MKDDTISRTAAVKTVKKHYRGIDNDLLEVIAYEMERLPPTQPGWIPVTERLPKPEDEVLLTMDYKGRRCVEMGNIWSDGTVHSYIDEYLTPDGRKYRKVVAWMPLPTPYREGGQE